MLLGKPVDDMNRMMGEIGVISGGNITNFSSMVDGAEGFGSQIDAIGSLEHQMKGLGHPLPKQSLPQSNVSSGLSLVEGIDRRNQATHMPNNRLIELNQ